MNKNYKVLEFDKIKEKLKEYTMTDKAKEEVDNLRPILSKVELDARLRDTTEAKIMIENCGNPPATSLSGISEYIDRAISGDCLSAEKLEEVANLFTAVQRIKDYLNRCKRYELSLPFYEENLDAASELREEINMMIRNGQVDDYASKLLKNIREDIDKTNMKMREKADTIIRSNKECMSDSFSTFRNGHICIPVKKDYKVKISGAVIDKSSTGNTLFIEPKSVAKYYEKLEELKIDEENEVMRILYYLTDRVAEKASVMQENSKIIEKLDYVFAKGKLSISYNGVMPIMSEGRIIRIKNGRHPLMDQNINVPLNFIIGDQADGVVITGPNTGGKTVAIKTVALNCLMAQCGLHVACEEAEIAMRDMYLCDIGDGQNISENLSTFSAHITNVLDILRKVDKDSLVIMDELGSGTDPTEGMGIAIAILKELKKSGALYLVTTHYPEVKNYALKEDRVVNARMTFDKESLKPLYQLVIGEAGESCAFYIARRLGMPADMLRNAMCSAYGDNDINSNLFEGTKESIIHESGDRLVHHRKKTISKDIMNRFSIGDSVYVLPDNKIGIVCEPIDEKGVLRVMLPDKKIYISHKRVKLNVKADQLYPDDYDFSIIFDSVEDRKKRHLMNKRHVEGIEIRYDEKSSEK